MTARYGRRAATISLAHDTGDLVWQLLLLVASVAVCLWPAALYRGLAGRADVWFWTLGAAGASFLPMSLLTATLFQGIDALNRCHYPLHSCDVAGVYGPARQTRCWPPFFCHPVVDGADPPAACWQRW
jgi:hypothetical protein